jgi:hypothetical protein
MAADYQLARIARRIASGSAGHQAHQNLVSARTFQLQTLDL